MKTWKGKLHPFADEKMRRLVSKKPCNRTKVPWARPQIPRPSTTSGLVLKPGWPVLWGLDRAWPFLSTLALLHRPVGFRGLWLRFDSRKLLRNVLEFNGDYVWTLFYLAIGSLSCPCWTRFTGDRERFVNLLRSRVRSISRSLCRTSSLANRSIRSKRLIWVISREILEFVSWDRPFWDSRKWDW